MQLPLPSPYVGLNFTPGYANPIFQTASTQDFYFESRINLWMRESYYYVECNKEGI